MKLRTGFVSNSSSTSFCLIGVGDEDVMDKILNLFMAPDGELDYDKFEESGMERYNSDYCSEWGVGFPVEDFLKERTIEQGKEDFVKIMKEKYDMDIDIEEVSFILGCRTEG